MHQLFLLDVVHAGICYGVHAKLLDFCQAKIPAYDGGKEIICQGLTWDLAVLGEIIAGDVFLINCCISLHLVVLKAVFVLLGYAK